MPAKPTDKHLDDQVDHLFEAYVNGNVEDCFKTLAQMEPLKAAYVASRIGTMLHANGERFRRLLFLKATE